MNKNKQLTLGSLFSGSGGFELAGQMAGIKPIWDSEIEPFPIMVTTKRFPDVTQLGDVNRINGAKITPVDIITFGSPCQDLSIAGRRAGLELEGGRSNLFYEAIRIIKEMRGATNGKYPTYAVWENVPGVFSSNSGDDFRSVLEAFCRISDAEVHVPKPKKWEPAGEVLGDGYSVAWRILDAQYWGVPQRRKRIFLVADFASDRAGKILFESEGVSGNPEPRQGEGQGTASGSERGLGAAGNVCLIDHGGQRMDIMDGVSTALRATFGHPPIVLNDQGGAQIDVSANITATLRAQEHGHQPCVLFENHAQDSRYTGPIGTAPTVLARYGTGGNNQPLVYEMGHSDHLTRVNTDVAASLAATDYKDPPAVLPVRTFSAQSYAVNHTGASITEIAKTLDQRVRNGAVCSQGGMAILQKPYVADCGEVYEIEDVETLDTSAPKGNGINKSVSFTLNAPDGYAVQNPQYQVRRLTPVECARLQGFPDNWCDDLSIENPTEEQIAFWTDVFETHRRLVTHASKARTEQQVRKWLKSPYSDAAAYKLWGNGVALPCVYFVMSGIAYHANAFRRESSRKTSQSGVGTPTARHPEYEENGRDGA